MENKYYVYIHYNNDKPFYVGKGTGNRYKDSNSRNKHWNNTVNKYDEIRFQIVSQLINEEDSYELEEFIIKEIGLSNLTNVSAGGDMVTSPYDRRGENNPMYGKVHPNKGKNLMQCGHQKRTGLKHTKESNKQNALNQPNRVEITVDGATYSSYTKAAKALGLSRYGFTSRYKKGYYNEK